MTGIQLFYLTIMVGLLVLYLSIARICEAKEVIAQSKAVQAIEEKNITRVNVENKEQFEEIYKSLKGERGKNNED